MGTELPTKVMLGQTLVLIQMTFLNNVRKVGRLVLSRTSCFLQQAKYSALTVEHWMLALLINSFACYLHLEYPSLLIIPISNQFTTTT
jgi:hypothetical protein